MFNVGANVTRTVKKGAGEKTKAAIFETALELFRRRGFEVTTMRHIARSAKVATGAAYYYQVHRLHEEKVRLELGGKTGLRERLGVAMHSKLEILKDDRMFLGALFRYTGDPDHPLSVFGKGTDAQRSQSVAIFQEAIAGTNVSEALRLLLPWVLWLAHLGLILFFLYDETEGQQRTHTLADGILDLLTQFVVLTSSALVRPFVQPWQTRILGMLREAGWTGEI